MIFKGSTNNTWVVPIYKSNNEKLNSRHKYFLFVWKNRVLDNLHGKSDDFVSRSPEKVCFESNGHWSPCPKAFHWWTLPSLWQEPHHQFLWGECENTWMWGALFPLYGRVNHCYLRVHIRKQIGQWGFPQQNLDIIHISGPIYYSLAMFKYSYLLFGKIKTILAV